MFIRYKTYNLCIKYIKTFREAFVIRIMKFIILEMSMLVRDVMGYKLLSQHLRAHGIIPDIIVVLILRKSLMYMQLDTFEISRLDSLFDSFLLSYTPPLKLINIYIFIYSSENISQKNYNTFYSAY